MTPWEKKLANNPPGRIVRRTSRALTGGAVLFLAFLLFMFLRFGAGTGSDAGSTAATGDASPEAGSTSPPMVSRAVSSTGATTPLTSDTATGLSADEKQALSGAILTLLIDERSYLMQIPAPGGPAPGDPVYRPVSLERAVDLAAMATGDSNGIKVRILRRENARASAEEKLKLEFGRRGIDGNAILMPDSLLP